MPTKHPTPPTPDQGGFRFNQLSARVDAEAVLALEREEMIDLLITTHWDQADRSAAHLSRMPAGSYKLLFAKSSRDEGYFLIWNGPGELSLLNRETFRNIVDEAKQAGLRAPFHVYARMSSYSGPNIEFYQIPLVLCLVGHVDAASPAAVEDALGPIVYPDLPSYKRSSAWRLAQVLEALGVDASELEDLGQLEDLEETDEAEETVPAEDAYDFTSYPPGACLPRACGRRSRPPPSAGRPAAAVIEAGQLALEARWPGAFRVGCEFKDNKLAITLRPLMNEAEHAAAWAAYMADNVPRGYVVEGIGGGVEWACPARPEEGRTVSFHVDAIAECWRAYLHRDADVCADLLALAGVWGDGMGPTEGVQAERIRWVSSWTLLERGQAMRWAAASCLHASDHDDVKVPDRPACLDAGRPA